MKDMKDMIGISTPLTEYETILLTHMVEKEPRFSIKGWDDDPESWAAITLARRGFVKAESAYVFLVTDRGIAWHQSSKQLEETI